MPGLIIDQMAVEVPAGTKVIEAAERLGIMIPRFCYLKALGAVGACRMCAVAFVAGPVKGVEMSCMVEAADGMVVSTTHPEAVAFRRQVIEWLMVNHPHDCPVCDEGGQCLLQDETVAGGHGLRRYPGRKRTYRDQELGPLIQQEMNRCIHCYRCSRFYQEYAGYRDFGVLQIGNRIFYGRFAAGPLESPFAGNLADICPTGVFTDKPARFRARRWDMQRVPSLCVHCALGCNTVANGFHREIIRQEARENDAVNGSFICDRGRFGCFYANLPDRPWRPLIEQKAAGWEEALAAAADRLGNILAQHGPQAVAVLASPRASLETLWVLTETCRRLALSPPQLFADPGLAGRVRRATARLEPGLAISLADVARADCILVMGADPVNEAPMLALAIRQAARRGAAVAVVDPRPVALPLDFVHLPAPRAEMPLRCGLLVHLGLDRAEIAGLGGELLSWYDSLGAGQDAPPDAAVREVAARIKGCRRPAVICGTGIGPDELPDLAADLARLLAASKEQCGLFYVLPGANGFAAGILGDPGAMTLPEIVAAVAEERVKAIVAVETDPFHEYPDRQRLEQALARAQLVVCLDYLPSPLARRAHILCPTTTHFEAAASFVNNEGRPQTAAAVHAPGRPLALISGGAHPPREFASLDPDPPRPAGRILQELAARMQGEDARPDLAGSPGRAPLPELGFSPAGDRLLRPAPAAGFRPLPPAAPQPAAPGELELILTEWTYGTEELSSYSGPIRAAGQEPVARMHAADAAAAGLASGDQVIVHLARGRLRLPLATSTSMAQGCLVLPRHRDIDWQQCATGRAGQGRCRIAPACGDETRLPGEGR